MAAPPIRFLCPTFPHSSHDPKRQQDYVAAVLSENIAATFVASANTLAIAMVLTLVGVLTGNVDRRWGPLLHLGVLGEFNSQLPVSVRVVPELKVVSNPLGQDRIGGVADLSGLTSVPPLVIAGALDAQQPTHLLHLMGVTVVVNELEAVLEVVSAAKYFVALRKIVRSSSRRCASARRPRLSAFN